MMSARHTQHTSQSSATASTHPTPTSWLTIEDEPSDIEGEDEETDELIADEDDVIILQPATPTSVPSATTGRAATRSRGPNAQSNSTRTATRAPHTAITIAAPTAVNDSATTEDAAENAVATSSRKSKKRRRRDSASDVGNDHQRAVKLQRSRAPSPPSLPSTKVQPREDAPPLSSSDDATIDSRTRASGSAAASTSATTTTSPTSNPAQQHASTAPISSSDSVAVILPRTENGLAAQPCFLVDPIDRNAIEAQLVQLLNAVRSRNTATSTSAVAEAVEDVMDVDNIVQDVGSSVNAPQTPAPRERRASNTPQNQRSNPRGHDGSSVARAISVEDKDEEDEDPAYNTRRSRMFLRSLGASYRMHGNPPVPTTSANRTASPIAPLFLRNSATVVPHASRADTWNEVARSIYGPGSETRGLTKPKPPRKSRVKVTASNAASSVPPSEAMSSRAISERASSSRAGSIAQPIDVDATPLSPEELQDQANAWAALVRSFVKGKNTRTRNQDALLRALCDAGTTEMSSLVLARSGLYAAVRALGQQAAGEMFAPVDAARALAERWVGEFGEGALEEEV
ncbi:unnamed protein product [Peniophora sp. CBMAI 1063]|nr:unnamed protein product [Peniophora sp. CBMAI 1063]